MTSELIHSKEAGKERIEHALLGLVIALGAYALLFTINPDLLKTEINPPVITITSTLADPAGDCLLADGTILKKTQSNCGLNVNSQSWNGTATSYTKGDCILASGATVRTTRAGCESNPTSQSWNGMVNQNNQNI